MHGLQDLNAVVYVRWRRVEHQRTPITIITLGLLFLLWLRCFVSFLLGLLLGRYSQALYSLDSRVDRVFHCVRHVVAVESEVRWAGIIAVVSQTLHRVV